MQKKNYFKLSIVLCIMFFLNACIQIPGINKTPNNNIASTNELLNIAEKAYNRGDFEVAAKNYALYLNQEKNPPRLEVILTSYGLAAENSAYYKYAEIAYSRLLKEFPNSQYSKDIQYRLLNVYIANNNPKEAEKLSRLLLNAENNAGLKEELEINLANSLWMQKNYNEASKIFLKLKQETQNKSIKKRADEGLIASLTNLNIKELEDLNSQIGQNSPAAELNYILIYRYVESQNIAKANEQIEYFYKYFSLSPIENNVKKLVNNLKETNTLNQLNLGANYKPQGNAPEAKTTDLMAIEDGNIGEKIKLNGVQGTVTIVALLPFSDAKSSKYAQEIFNGISLALQQNKGQLPINLVKMDTKGDPNTAANIINNLKSDPSVIAIIGPFLNREAELASQAAQSAKIPMLAISQRVDLPNAGSYIFRIFLTPKHQVDAAVEYTSKVLNHNTFGIIYSNDTYGQTLKKYYEEAIIKNGGTLVNAQSYDLEAKNWDVAVKNITGGKAARKVSAKYQAATGFTVLFIPDSANVIAQILPILAFHDVTQIQHIGTPMWLGKDLLTNSSRYIQNVVIPVAVSPLSENPSTSLFYGHYKQSFETEPEQLSAYGYDATLAIINALNKGAGTKEELIKTLTNGSKIKGVTGNFNFSNNGEYEIQPMLLTVTGQNFKLLRDAQ